MSAIKKNLATVLEAIALARKKSNAGPVTLIAATKGQSVETISEYVSAAKASGIKAICGENYAQDLANKKAQLPDVEFHFIGTLQRNKATLVLRNVSTIQSVDSSKLAWSLQKGCAAENVTRNYLLQVNVSSDPGKGGFSFEQAREFLASEVLQLERLKFCGFMTITAAYDTAEEARHDFKALREFSESMQRHPPVVQALEGRRCELSMGMSADYVVAIEEGATMVRVGSSLFGARG